jgi:molybdenum cofactor cytidylyltransferase
LFAPIFQPGGKKLLAKGHLISEEDVHLLGSAGLDQVCVALIEDEEVPEKEAALRIAGASLSGSLELQAAPGGRANIVAKEPCCLLVNDDALHRLNQCGILAMATMPRFSYAAAGQRVATVNTTPFAVPMAGLVKALETLASSGPAIEGRAITNPSVGVLYTDAQRAERGRSLFDAILRTRFQRAGLAPTFVMTAIEEEEAVARALHHLIRARPNVVLIASTTAPAGPDDVVGRAMRRVECEIESFLAPVEPGNLLLLSYRGDTAVIAAPGCFRSPRPNVIDLILPPLLSRYRLSAAQIATLGHGGLLQ